MKTPPSLITGSGKPQLSRMFPYRKITNLIKKLSKNVSNYVGSNYERVSSIFKRKNGDPEMKTDKQSKKDSEEQNKGKPKRIYMFVSDKQYTGQVTYHSEAYEEMLRFQRKKKYAQEMLLKQKKQQNKETLNNEEKNKQESNKKEAIVQTDFEEQPFIEPFVRQMDERLNYEPEMKRIKTGSDSSVRLKKYKDDHTYDFILFQTPEQREHMAKVYSQGHRALAQLIQDLKEEQQQLQRKRFLKEKEDLQIRMGKTLDHEQLKTMKDAFKKKSQKHKRQVYSQIRLEDFKSTRIKQAKERLKLEHGITGIHLNKLLEQFDKQQTEEFERKQKEEAERKIKEKQEQQRKAKQKRLQQQKIREEEQKLERMRKQKELQQAKQALEKKKREEEAKNKEDEDDLPTFGRKISFIERPVQLEHDHKQVEPCKNEQQKKRNEESAFKIVPISVDEKKQEVPIEKKVQEPVIKAPNSHNQSVEPVKVTNAFLSPVKSNKKNMLDKMIEGTQQKFTEPSTEKKDNRTSNPFMSTEPVPKLSILDTIKNNYLGSNLFRDKNLEDSKQAEIQATARVVKKGMMEQFSNPLNVLNGYQAQTQASYGQQQNQQISQQTQPQYPNVSAPQYNTVQSSQSQPFSALFASKNQTHLNFQAPNQGLSTPQQQNYQPAQYNQPQQQQQPQQQNFTSHNMFANYNQPPVETQGRNFFSMGSNPSTSTVNNYTSQISYNQGSQNTGEYKGGFFANPETSRQLFESNMFNSHSNQAQQSLFNLSPAEANKSGNKSYKYQHKPAYKRGKARVDRVI